MNKKIPNQLLKKLNLVFKNERVYYAKNKFFSISIKKILLLKKFLPKNQKIFRICLHINDKEKIHEMIIVHLKPQTIGPLKQKKQTEGMTFQLKSSYFLIVHQSSRKELARLFHELKLQQKLSEMKTSKHGSPVSSWIVKTLWRPKRPAPSPPMPPWRSNWPIKSLMREWIYP